MSLRYETQELYTYHKVSGKRGTTRDEGIGEELRANPCV